MRKYLLWLWCSKPKRVPCNVQFLNSGKVCESLPFVSMRFYKGVYILGFIIFIANHLVQVRAIFFQAFLLNAGSNKYLFKRSGIDLGPQVGSSQQQKKKEH